MTSSARAARWPLAASLFGAVALLAAGCSSGGTAAPPPSTVTVTQPPGSGATAPSPTPSATTAPAQPGECTTAALHVTAGTSQGAAGTIYYDIDFTNVSSSSCVLAGYPGVSLVSVGNAAGSQIGSDAKRSSASPASPVTLTPGGTAHAQLGVAQAGAFPVSKCQPVTAHWLKVFPPDQTVAAYVSFSTATCASTSVSTMRISTISAGA
jgi:hypothetical protein